MGKAGEKAEKGWPPNPEGCDRCPFCGGQGRVFINPGIWDGDSWDVSCDDCTARIQAFKTSGEARAAWNRRAVAFGEGDPAEKNEAHP